MHETFWERFPKTAKIHCIEVKDRAQERVARETRGLSSDQLFAYFREASQRFWSEIGRVYPKAAPTTPGRGTCTASRASGERGVALSGKKPFVPKSMA